MRQLENICRWITVMASGREVHIERSAAGAAEPAAGLGAGDQLGDKRLRQWADQALARGQ